MVTGPGFESPYQGDDEMPANRVLIVDDDHLERQTWVRILGLEGYQVSSADSGLAALAWLKNNPCEVLVLDLKMPDMNGIEVLREVNRAYPAVKTIILIAHGNMDAAVQALRLKASDFLTKPIQPGELISAIKRITSAAVTGNPIDQSGLWNFQGASRELDGKNLVYATMAGVRFDLKIRKIFWQDIELSLTPIEAKTIEALIENYQNLVAPERLVYLIYDYQTNAQDAAKTLRPIISRLYKKLSVISGGEHWIQNVRGSGYLLNFSPDQLIR